MAEAVVIREPGPPEVLRLEYVPDPGPPGPGRPPNGPRTSGAM